MAEQKNDKNIAIINPDFGAGLLERARKSRSEKFGDNCVAEVETVMNLIDITKERIRTEEQTLIILEARLTAIAAAEISFDYSSGSTRIIYTDERLNTLPQHANTRRINLG